MAKEGKFDLLSVLILSIFIFVVYAFFVSSTVPLVSPGNNTNASATRGFADGVFPNQTTFNGSLGQFQCNVTTNATSINITNVSLFINFSTGSAFDINNVTSVRNQTLNTTTTGITPDTIIFNVTTAFNEGTYVWWCESENNESTIMYNQSGYNFFIIDRTEPGFNNLVSKNSSNSVISTGDTITISANFSDQLTSILGVRLFVNISGNSDNEVNTTGKDNVGFANATYTNLTFVIPGSALGHTLNFTLQVNDSVNNVNITNALIFYIGGDGTPPGPINLSNPDDKINQSSATVEFNFSASDNNASSILTCIINISTGGFEFKKITNIKPTLGVLQLNSTSISNGSYSWNVSCTDGPGNINFSVARTFTVDQIPPVIPTGANGYYNFTHNSTWDTTKGHSGLPQLGTGDNGASSAQGRTIYGVANWTDNLTQPFQGRLQFYNISTLEWKTINQSVSTYKAVDNLGWTNFSFVLPTGHNNFEGANVSFRIIANDTLGNINETGPFLNNFTIEINDTTVPTTTLNSFTNDTNTSDITPTLNFTMIDKSAAVLACSLVLDGVTNVSTISIISGNFSNITLTTEIQGKHNWSVNCTDAADNTFDTGNITFTIDNTTPTISLDLASNSNITSLGIITVTTTDTQTAVKTNTFTTSCGASGTYTSGTSFAPFNDSTGACTGAAVKTLTITATDHADNSNVSSFLFGVDNTAPSVTIVTPTAGENFINTNVTFNITSTDGFVKISFIGYYLNTDSLTTIKFDESGLFINNTVSGVAAVNVSLNLTPGTHTVKFTANDTVGNFKNSSVITFTIIGPLPPANEISNSTSTYLSLINNAPINLTLRLKDSAGSYTTLSSNVTDSNQTFEILIYANHTSANDQLNITLTDINGSGVNWNKINFSVLINNTGEVSNLESNWTNTVINYISFNNSIDEFTVNNNNYYGTVLLSSNISSNLTGGLVTGGLFQEIWWLEDETNLKSRTNITKCTVAFTAITTIPCWNYSSGGKTLVQVPHFSTVIAVNDSGAPTITVNKPDGNQSVSMFRFNITVTSDTRSCNYQRNESNGHVEMTLTGTTCIGQTERYNNSANSYNITINATDRAGNVQTAFFQFNVSDTTAPDNGLITTISIVSDSASIKTTGVNESVNLTLNYGTVNTTLAFKSHQTDFNITQTASISGLTGNTVYYYNVTVCDFNNNCKTNGTFTFRTTKKADDDSGGGASSGASGSVGGGVVSNTKASRAQVWSSIPSGSSVSIKVDNAQIAVTKVTVTVNTEVTNVELSVASLIGKPVSSNAAAKVYQYLKIFKKNIKDSEASDIKIEFRVPKSWLSDNGLASADIALYRYKNQVWTRLSAKVTGTDATHVSYESDVPGLSFFAIGSKTAASGELILLLDMIDSFYATGSPTLLEILDAIDSYYAAGGG